MGRGKNIEKDIEMFFSWVVCVTCELLCILI